VDWYIYQLSEGTDCLYFRVDATVKVEASIFSEILACF
jgi:hypothetical protein